MAMLARLFAVLMAVIVSGIPDGYILKVRPECGSYPTDNAIIHVLTDLNAYAMAECANGYFEFTTIDDVNHRLEVSYLPGNDSVCIFEEAIAAHAYFLDVIVAYGEEGSMILGEEKVYSITCTFDPRLKNETSNNIIINSLIAPSEIQQHKGVVANSTVAMAMTDVLGRSVGQDVPLGKIVYLEAHSTGSEDEVGLRAVSCNAVAVATNHTYAILRAGCGDGLIFKKDQGFTTTNGVSTSPYFEVFTIQDESDIKFECNFTLCSHNCDGSSCENERKRRSYTSHPKHKDHEPAPITTRTVLVSLTGIRRSRHSLAATTRSQSKAIFRQKDVMIYTCVSLSIIFMFGIMLTLMYWSQYTVKCSKTGFPGLEQNSGINM